MIWRSWTWLGTQVLAVLARSRFEEENGAAGAVESALGDVVA